MRVIATLTILAAFLLAGCAAAPTAPDVAGDPTPAKARYTGSYIPQEVGKNPRRPATASPLYVMSRDEMQRTGETDVARALRKLPFFD